jgi:hypothetical protein
MLATLFLGKILLCLRGEIKTNAELVDFGSDLDVSRALHAEAESDKTS